MNKSNECIEHVTKLLHLYLRTQKSYFSDKDTGYIRILSQKGVLVKSDKDGLYKINFDSTLLCSILYDFIEKEIDQKLTNDFKISFQLIEAFKEKKKKEYNCENTINAYSDLIDGFKAYILYYYHSNKEIDIIKYYDDLNKNDKKKIKRYFLHALLFIEISTEKFLAILLEDGDNTRNDTIKCCSELCIINFGRAYSLLSYLLNKEYDDRYFYMIANLFFGLHRIDSNIFNKRFELFQKNNRLGYFVLARINLINKDEIIECFQEAEKAQNNDVDVLLEIPYLCKTLIENKNTPQNIRELCFRKLEYLFLIENERIKDEVFQMCSWIEGYEKEKYNLLINTFLSKSQNYYEKISLYFREFENPKYFFHLYTNLHLISIKNGNRFNTKIFQEAFSRFWRKNKEITSNELFKLLIYDNPNVRLGAVELIRTLNQQELTNLDLLVLKSEIYQLRAIEALIFTSYYDIEAILGLILNLEKSPYPKVVEYLQKKLSELIFHSYHDFLFEKIDKTIKNKEFKRPLTEALKGYHRMCNFKMEINDLNPAENEKDFMNTYYRLEAEANRKMFKNIDKGTFLEMVKESTIVRGNAWKIGDNDISPLGKFESSMSLDISMYKNPDLFDFQKNNFKSEF